MKPCIRRYWVIGMSVTSVVSTLVSSLTELSAGTGSTSFAVTLALLVIVPSPAPVVTRISTLALPPLMIVPRLQVIVDVPEQQCPGSD